MSSQLERLIFGEPRARELFPLLIEFDMVLPTGQQEKRRAGFKNWDHWKSYAHQMYTRNKIKCRHPKAIMEPNTH